MGKYEKLINMKAAKTILEINESDYGKIFLKRDLSIHGVAKKIDDKFVRFVFPPLENSNYIDAVEEELKKLGITVKRYILKT